MLETAELGQKIGKEEYEAQVLELRFELLKAQNQLRSTPVPVILVITGDDRPGCNEVLNRLHEWLDARYLHVHAPDVESDEERAHHYLWRFWRHIPARGRIAIFDRSWYGRVLVERVEGFARPEEWMRAYAEINDFEEQLQRFGVRVVKFWIHIDKGEQLRRFREREKTPHKQHKITAEDWRNRERWDAHRLAVDEMIGRTSTDFAPWIIVAGNDKRLARLQVLRAVNKALK
jgi:polyphosphate kinase 2 (PPK2 family)